MFQNMSKYYFILCIAKSESEKSKNIEKFSIFYHHFIKENHKVMLWNRDTDWASSCVLSWDNDMRIALITDNNIYNIKYENFAGQMIQASRRFILHLHVSILQLNVLISTFLKYLHMRSQSDIFLLFYSFFMFCPIIIIILRSLCGGIFLKLAHVMTYMTTFFWKISSLLNQFQI